MKLYTFIITLLFSTQAVATDCPNKNILLPNQQKSLVEKVFKAVYDGDLGALSDLVEHGAPVNVCYCQAATYWSYVFAYIRCKNIVNCFHSTLLHGAVQDGNPHIVEYLLLRGADPNALDGLGNRPLHYAAEQSDTKLVELLLQYGANIRAVNLKKETALHRLLSNTVVPELACVQKLCCAGVQIDAEDIGRATGLSLANFFASTSNEIIYFLEDFKDSIISFLNDPQQKKISTKEGRLVLPLECVFTFLYNQNQVEKKQFSKNSYCLIMEVINTLTRNDRKSLYEACNFISYSKAQKEKWRTSGLPVSSADLEQKQMYLSCIQKQQFADMRFNF